MARYQIQIATPEGYWKETVEAATRSKAMWAAYCRYCDQMGWAKYPSALFKDFLATANCSVLS